MNWKRNSKILIIESNQQIQSLSNLITELRSTESYIILTDKREEILEYIKLTGLKILLRARIIVDYLDEKRVKINYTLK